MKTLLVLAALSIGSLAVMAQAPTVYTASAPAQAPTYAPAPAAAPVAPPSAPAKRSAADLEKLVQPIALHPDPLLAILLPASVYPLEIVQAARFVKDTNNIAKLDTQPWDDNVKELAKFPDLIAKMDADLPWTVELGQAFLDQRKELMDTIQSLRAKAHKAGTLQSGTQQVVTVTNVVLIQTNLTQVVTVTNQIIQVQPSSSGVIYVPSYPPTVYYPPPAYVYNPYAPLVSFSVGFFWGAAIANNCDWHHGDVDVDIDRNVNRNVDRDRNVNTGARPSTTAANRAGASATQRSWQPDQSRLNKSGSPAASAQSREARGWGGTSSQPAARPSAGTGAARPAASTRPAANVSRPAATPSVSRPSPAVSRPTATPSVPRANPAPAVNRPAPSGGAFGGMGSGAGARASSSRGAVSRGGGGGRGGR